ncbi:thioesterase II family protein [Pseudomonas putida]|uniref:thioesterase II family protein n=1 Tax=Pseudomonas putida TaxID=303 RepID=UPI0005BE28AC|nr:thioesterase domain-containing protein [Pseudomonas putida]
MTNLELFCLPYSGTSATVYNGWRRSLPAWLSVVPVELPAAGARLCEPLVCDMQVLARQLTTEMSARINGPYALFGHGLGALLAYELAVALREAGAPCPAALIASGTAAPTRCYESAPGAPLDCPLHVLGGVDDKATQEALLAWQLHTSVSFSLDMLAGGHGFLHEHEPKVLRILRRHLEVDLRRLALAAA